MPLPFEELNGPHNVWQTVSNLFDHVCSLQKALSELTELHGILQDNVIQLQKEIGELRPEDTNTDAKGPGDIKPDAGDSGGN